MIIYLSGLYVTHEIILKVPKGQIWTIFGSIDIRHKMAMQDLIRMRFIEDYERII